MHRLVRRRETLQCHPGGLQQIVSFYEIIQLTTRTYPDIAYVVEYCLQERPKPVCFIGCDMVDNHVVQFRRIISHAMAHRINRVENLFDQGTYIGFMADIFQYNVVDKHQVDYAALLGRGQASAVPKVDQVYVCFAIFGIGGVDNYIAWMQTCMKETAIPSFEKRVQEPDSYQRFHTIDDRCTPVYVVVIEYRL